MGSTQTRMYTAVCLYVPHSHSPAQQQPQAAGRSRAGAALPRRHLASSRAGPGRTGAAGWARVRDPRGAVRGREGGGGLLPHRGVLLGSGVLR